MNNLIKELSKQAMDYAAQQYGPQRRGEQVWNPDIYDQKFAELIVLQCANHCDLLLDRNISSEWSRATHDCSRAIKQLFGVQS